MKLTLSLPHKVLSPNARPHWATKMTKTREYRATAKNKSTAALGRKAAPRWKAATIQYTFYWPNNRKRDRSNAAASMKAVDDGIQDAGVIEDDSGLVHLPVVFAVDKLKPRVEVVIEEIPDEA